MREARRVALPVWWGERVSGVGGERGAGRRGGWGWEVGKGDERGVGGGKGGTFLEGFLLLLLAVGGGGVEGAVFVFGHFGREVERL